MDLLFNFPSSKPRMCFAMASANRQGTAFPICLYLSANDPSKTYSAGKVWMAAYSVTERGLSSFGWHRSVAGMVGEVTRVGEGLSQAKRR